MSWYWDMLAKRAQYRQMGQLKAQSLFDTAGRQQTAEEGRGLLGSEAQPAQFGQFGAPQDIAQPSPDDAFNRRFTTQLTPGQEGTGYLGSDMGRPEQAKFMLEAQAAGYSPQEASGLLSTATPQQQADQIGVKDIFSMEQDLAKQRTQMLKPYMEQRSQAQKTITALSQRTGAGDLAAVISFNKALDPTSVVRESEQKAVTGVAGPIERLRAIIGEIGGEGQLTDDTRSMLASLIEEIQINETMYANNIVQDFTQRAEGYQLDPMRIRGGQLGFDAQGQPIKSFSPLSAPKEILNEQDRARMEMRRRGLL